jgi:hypothetical protein
MPSRWSPHGAGALTLAALVAAGPRAAAQDEAASPSTSQNTTAGEFTPGTGFNIIKTDQGTLNISVYGLARYLNQLPADEAYTDHLGRPQVAKTRNDINWHRTFVWLSGFFWRPELRYTISIWSLPTTQQTLVFGNLRYKFGRALELATGIAPNLGSRSMQGSWPYFLATDRQMADEFFRPGFTSSVWASGEPFARFWYTVSLGNNISQLGVPSRLDTRELTQSASVWWMPTTGEFGPRGGFIDFEEHETVATRFGLSAVRARENRYAEQTESTNNTQIRLSDGLLLFDPGSLADGVSLEWATYALLATDAGLKWRGFNLQVEYYFRWLWDFVASGPLPLTSIFDHGFYVQASQMVVPNLLAVYAVTSIVFDQFQRYPWEVSGGVSFYPTRTRSWRLNLHYIYVDKSPAGSQFGYYINGQTGSTISLATDFLL